MNMDGQTLAQVKILHAYAFILQKVYGIDLDFEYPLILYHDRSAYGPGAPF
jgi:hypothetical protein